MLEDKRLTESKSQQYDTKVHIVNRDCVELARELILQSEGKAVPLVLNLAQRQIGHVCGAWNFPYLGSQEEHIERRSALPTTNLSIDDLNCTICDVFSGLVCIDSVLTQL